MCNLLEGKTAIVTGGTRGIGASIVREFVDQGAKVAFTYVSSAEAAIQLESELNIGGEVVVKGYKSDASVFEASEKLIADVSNDFGGFTVIVNNAGITKDNLMLRMTEEMWDRVMEVNLKSVFNMTRHGMRSMLRSGGSIINMSSVVGVHGNSGQANYAASKAGIVGFSKSIALEVGRRNIRCNVVAPGFIATDMTEELADDVKKQFLAGIPMSRWGNPKEVADVCVWLASDMSSYVSGQVISVDGALYT